MTQIPSAPPQSAPYQNLDWTWQGHRIRYAIAGQGDPLVLIHGFGASIGHWRKNIPTLAEAGYQVFAIDMLGFGASEKPGLDYSLELWEAMLADFCREKVQAPAVLVGNSIGGLLTLMLLAHQPDLVAGGVLLNCAGGLNHRPEELSPPLRLIMGTFSKVVSAPVIGPFMFNRIRQKRRLRSTLKQVYCNPDAVTDELIDILHQPSCDPGAQAVFASILTAAPGPRPVDLLPQIRQPMLVLWGEADPWTPISGAAIYRDLAQQNPGQVTFQSIADTGHCPHDECPDQVNALILDWLRRKTD